VSVFGSYARFYDLLYRDKDYAAEAAYAAERLREVAPGARRLLELGSGTGSHALELGRAGFELTGIELSGEMVACAQARRGALEPAVRERLRFLLGDARSARLEQPFDAVLALFHVLSYQTTNADLSGMLATAAAHLRPGGAFFFDFWYGPAVLSEKPAPRTRRLQDGGVALTRTAEPLLRENDNCVDVRYTLTVEGAGSRAPAERFEELHSMRYFFLPELELALSHAGFDLVAAGEMTTGAALSARSWSASALARRR